MGHSRGGEAAALAATFNRLKYYPDDFKQEFKFNFDDQGGRRDRAGGRAVQADRPVHAARERQLPADPRLARRRRLDGAWACGSTSGCGSPTVSRGSSRSSSCTARITASGTPSGATRTTVRAAAASLDLRALIDPEAQRQFAKVVISGFLEATLHGKREYLPMFRDHRTAGAWLPKTMYTTRFQESGYRALAEFDDDVDLTTGIGARRDDRRRAPVDVERERRAVPRPRHRHAESQRRLDRLEQPSWRPTDAGRDGRARPRSPPTAGRRPTPPCRQRTNRSGRRRRTRSPSRTRCDRDWGVGERSVVYLSLAATNTKPGPRTPPKDPKKEEEPRKRRRPRRRSRRRNRRPKPKAPPEAEGKREAGRDADRAHRRSSWTPPVMSRGCRSAASASRAIRSTRASTGARAATRSASRTSTS